MLTLIFPNISYKFVRIFLFVCLVFVSSCSSIWDQKAPENIMNSEERNKYIVYNILWPFFEMESEKNSLTTPFIQIQNTCFEKDFLSYRKCFIDALTEEYHSIIYTSQQEEFYQTFLGSLKKEMEYYPYYRELARMDYPSRERFSIDNKDCYIVGTGSYRTEYVWKISETSTDIQLSYSSEERENLLQMFPSWKDAYVYDTASFTGSYYDPNNPCLFRTFWPAYWNIIFTRVVWDVLFLFIKVNEWAWSGEFNYSVFVFNKDSRQYINIGSFWAWGGIIPFQDNLNLEEEKISPLDIYKNQPFLYYSFFEDRRIRGDTVEQLFSKHIK